MLRPTPTWLEHGASDSQLSQLDQIDVGLLDRPDLVRTIEALAAQLHGTDRTNPCTVGGQHPRRFGPTHGFGSIAHVR
jgi:hypothetical protein